MHTHTQALTHLHICISTHSNIDNIICWHISPGWQKSWWGTCWVDITTQQIAGGKLQVPNVVTTMSQISEESSSSDFDKCPSLHSGNPPGFDCDQRPDCPHQHLRQPARRSCQPASRPAVPQVQTQIPLRPEQYPASGAKTRGQQATKGLQPRLPTHQGGLGSLSALGIYLLQVFFHYLFCCW